MLYFKLLPNELILELSLYFNYRDTILLCSILNCKNPHIWITKIHKELGYGYEFITQYVYDNTTQTSKTLLPLNEKYLELKARKTADFGTEFYQNMSILIVHISRSNDFQLADELVHYFLILSRLISRNDLISMYMTAVRGALGVKNFELVDKLLDEFNQEGPTTFDVTSMSYNIVAGIYEAYPKGNQDLLNKYVIHNVAAADIINGLAAGGHLKELDSYEPVSPSSLYAALYLGRKNIIDHYDLINQSLDGIRYIINGGYVELLPNLDSMDSIKRNETACYLVGNGYLEYVSLFTKEELLYTNPFLPIRDKIGIWGCINYNHLDMLNYLYRRFPDEVKAETAIIFSTYPTNEKLYNTSELTFKYLYENKIIDEKNLRVIPQNTLEIMKNYNNSAWQYIMSLI